MRIVQINNVYGRGSTGRITQDVHKGLAARGHQSAVLYGRGGSPETDAIKTSTEHAAKWNATKARIYSLQYAGARQSTRRILRYLDEYRPDVVHLQNLNGYFVNIYDLLEHLNAARQPTVVTLHAEFMYTGGCGHSLDCERWLNVPGCGSCPQLRAATKSLLVDRTRDAWLRMRSAFAGDLPHVAITSVSPWLRSRAEASPILGHLNHWTVLNGLDTDTFHRAEFEADSTPQEHDHRPMRLLHVTPLFTTESGSWKGGHDVLEVARLLGRDVEVTVVGRTAESMPDRSNVRFVGRVEDPDTLAQMYSHADAVLLTSRRETFSMVTAEALSCGTPVIGYRAGAPEQIALPEASHFVEQGDPVMLANACRELLRSGGRFRLLDRNGISRTARENYSTQRMVDGYLEVYASVARDAGRT